MPTFAGKLRHKVEFTEPDGTSHPAVRALVRGTTAREVEIANLDLGVCSYSIRMRASPSSPVPKARWKAVWQARELNILGSVDPTGKGRELLVYATEVE